MKKALEIPRETKEKIEVDLTVSEDPTGNAVSWAFAESEDRPLTWVTGSWVGSYVNGQATSASPTIGGTDSGADVLLAPGKTYVVYVRITDTPEVPVDPVGHVRVL